MFVITVYSIYSWGSFPFGMDSGTLFCSKRQEIPISGWCRGESHSHASRPQHVDGCPRGYKMAATATLCPFTNIWNAPPLHTLSFK